MLPEQVTLSRPLICSSLWYKWKGVCGPTESYLPDSCEAHSALWRAHPWATFSSVHWQSDNLDMVATYFLKFKDGNTATIREMCVLFVQNCFIFLKANHLATWSVVHGPQGSASLGSLLEMWNFRLHLEVLNQNLHCNKIPKEFVCTLKLEKHHGITHMHTWNHIQCQRDKKGGGSQVLRWRLVYDLYLGDLQCSHIYKMDPNNISQYFYSGMLKSTLKEKGSHPSHLRTFHFLKSSGMISQEECLTANNIVKEKVKGLW